MSRGSANVKGVAFRSAMDAYRELSGPEQSAGALQRMSPAVRNALIYGQIIASGWYDIEWYKDMLRAIVEQSGGRQAVVERIGVLANQRDMRGIYSLLAKLLSPQTLFAGSAKLFSTYYDTGAVKLLEVREGFAHALWEGCESFDKNMWIEIRGSCMSILEQAGARHVRLHVVAGGEDGDAFMEAHGYWS